MAFRVSFYAIGWRLFCAGAWALYIALLAFVVCFLVFVYAAINAQAHEWYLGLHGRDGQLCCGADDCEPTQYRERESHYEFFTREKHWIPIPQERITFLPVPGDENASDSHRAHLCYRPTNGVETNRENVFQGDGQSIYFYCAFIDPGST